ncbi:MAG: hypothetical protein M3P24_01195 [Gemmatimonadota bacterium]|nr:hypothetical protein [Gemmatimonadota bacterium]
MLTDTGPERHPVDLVEIFNLAYGLEVERLERWTNEEDGRLYRVVRARTGRSGACWCSGATWRGWTLG